MSQFVPNFLSYVLCQILYELVYSWESYHKNKNGELFIETQCSFDILAIIDYLINF